VNSALIAVGGNALIRAGETGHVDGQRANARRTAGAIARIVATGYHVVVTHGNGPQVGAALLRSERAGAHADGVVDDVVGRVTAQVTDV
jgi:carbamate kinase